MPVRTRWRDIKSKLAALDEHALRSLIHDLYEASPENRLFLQSRLLEAHDEIENYSRLIEDAIFPDPLSRKPVRIAEAKRLIRHYARASGDQAGITNLLLSAVAAGTEQARMGYGDDSYFGALLGMLAAAVGSIRRLSAAQQAAFGDRLRSIAHKSTDVGWGYGDAVHDLLAWQEAPAARSKGRRP